MKNVSKKLLEIQKEIKIGKNEENAFGGFKYRTLESIYAVAKPLLDKHNCTLSMTDDIVLVGERYYVKATATLIDNDSAESISVSAYGREDKERPKMCEAQVSGSSSTYARKYCLGGLFLLDDNKDPDSLDNTKLKESKNKDYQFEELNSPPISKDQIEIIKGLFVSLNKADKIVETLQKLYKVDSLDQLTKQQGEDLVAKLREKGNKNGKKG